MAVYFARAGNNGPVKIGYTSGLLINRIHNIQSSNAEDLVVLREYPKGTLEHEKFFHRKFEKSRIAREWFKYDPEIAIFLGDLSDFDRMTLFQIRLFEDEELQKIASGYLVSWLHSRAELSYYQGTQELREFLEDSGGSVDMKRPLDDMEIQYLTRKRWNLYAKKNG